MGYYPPITIASVVQKIDFRQYLLPAIQREFVWSSDKIELLFDSLMRDYPIGSLLMWKVSGKKSAKNHRYYSFLQHFKQKYKTHSEEVNTSTLDDFEAVLDGQQRLTAIYIGLKGTYAYKKPRVVMKDNEYALPTRKLYLNLSGTAPQDDTKGEVPDDGRLYDFQFLSEEELEKDKESIWFEVGNILKLQGIFQLNNFIKQKNWGDDEFICQTLSLLHEIIHTRPSIHYYLEQEGKAKGFCSKVAYKSDREIIKRWLHAVLLHGIFGGQADNVLKIIRDTVSKELSKGCSIFPANAIAKRLSKTRKSITVDEEFIENILYTQYEDRYSFPILALLYPHLDYKNGDFHKDHIHPIGNFSLSSLKKSGIDVTQISSDYYIDRSIYNGIANLQLLDGNLNESKQAKSLVNWVKSERVDLKKQLIPDVLKFDDFVEFVDLRWNILKERLKKELTF